MPRGAQLDYIVGPVQYAVDSCDTLTDITATISDHYLMRAQIRTTRTPLGYGRRKPYAWTCSDIDTFQLEVIEAMQEVDGLTLASLTDIITTTGQRFERRRREPRFSQETRELEAKRRETTDPETRRALSRALNAQRKKDRRK